jgi:hypothetical protein
MLHESRSSGWIYSGLTIFFFCLFSLPIDAQKLSTVSQDLHHDVSRPLRDMAKNAPAQAETEPDENEPVLRIPLREGYKPASEPDMVHQKMAPQPSSALQATPGLSFDGLGDQTLGFVVNGAPPDTDGAVGATQYVQWVNTSFAIFDKTTGNLIQGPTSGSALWTNFGGVCETGNRGDPVVTYDKLANRWVFSQFGFNTVNKSPAAPFTQCVAVSTTSDATGTFNRYSFMYNSFDDYPKMGVWPDAYYETFNLFNGNAFAGAEICAYDRTAMLAGNAATQVCFNVANQGGLLPADFDGTNPPPAGEPNFVMTFDVNDLLLWKFHVDFATPANSTFSAVPTTLMVSAFTPLCGGGTCIPQPGTTQQLDSLADRPMYRLAYRNFPGPNPAAHESLVLNHSVVNNSSGGVRWYEIQDPNGTPTVVQQSTWAPDSDFRWMGSIAMDKFGNMALGYSISSSATNPSIGLTGRLATDPVSTMEPEVVILHGTGQQVGTPARPLTRWGDYSAMQVDPVDDCTFWYTTEYMKTTGIFNWNTHIESFKLPGCPNPGAAQLTVTKQGVGTGTVTSSDGFINCGSACTATFNAAAMVTLTATPVTGSSFGSWTGCTSTTPVCTVTMSGAQAVVATFVLPNSTTTTVSPVNTTPAIGANITLTAMVAKTVGSATPTGTVTFFDGATQIGSPANINVSGVGSIQTSFATGGAHNVTASYSGDANYASSISAVVVVNVLQPDFNVTLPNGSTAMVKDGTSATYMINIVAQNGFTGVVSFSCTNGLPSLTMCGFNPTTVTGSGSTTLTISTTAPTAPVSSSSLGLGLFGTIGALGLVLAAALPGRRERWKSVFLLLGLLAMLAAVGSCGGGGSPPAVHNPGSPTGPSIVTVTATSGNLSHTSTVTLTIQ